MRALRCSSSAVNVCEHGFRGLAGDYVVTGSRARRPRTYQLTDRLHAGRTVHVSADGIASTLTVWLAELDV